MARQSGGVSALTRAVSLIEAFSVDAPFLTLTEIATRSGTPLSTTHRLVNELVDLGLIERMPDRTYRVGNRLWELGTRTPGAIGLREITLPYLHLLQNEIRQHAQLLVRSALDALVIDRLSARDAVVNASVVGGRTPLELTSSGIVMMAFEDEDLVDRVVERGIRTAAAGSLRSESDLRRAVATAAGQGFWIADGYLHPDARGIAAPIWGAHRVVVGALSVVVPVSSDRESTASFVQDAAARAGRALQRSYLPADHPEALAGGALRSLISSSDASMRFLEERLAH